MSTPKTTTINNEVNSKDKLFSYVSLALLAGFSYEGLKKVLEVTSNAESVIALIFIALLIKLALRW
jgi:hypothetical protein